MGTFAEYDSDVAGQEKNTSRHVIIDIGHVTTRGFLDATKVLQEPGDSVRSPGLKYVSLLLSHCMSLCVYMCPILFSVHWYGIKRIPSLIGFSISISVV